MKKLPIFVILAVLLCSCQQSKRISHLAIPDEAGSQGKEFEPLEPVNIDSVLAKYAGHDGVFLNVERTIEHAGSQKQALSGFLFGNLGGVWSYIDMERMRYVVINPEATRLTLEEFYSKPHKLYMIVTNPDGTERHYGLPDLKEEKEGDGKVYRLIYPDVRRGTMIEVGYEYAYTVKKYLPPLDYDVSLQFHMPCEKLDFSFAYPDWWEIKIKDTGPYSTVEYTKSEETAMRKSLVSYSASDIPAILKEPFCPYFKEVCKRLEFKVTSLTMGGSGFDRSISWQDVAESVYKNAIKTVTAGKGKVDINKLAQNLNQGTTSEYERLQRVLSYMQDSMEVTGDWKKAEYHKVVKQKKGGVLAISGLTCAALRHLKIPAAIVMIHPADDGYWDETYVDYSQAPIPAVRAKVDGEYYVVFPYIKELPLDHTPKMFQGQRALVIDHDGVGTLWTVPPGNRADNTTDESYVLHLRDDGIIDVNEIRTYRGAQAYYMREVLTELTDTELEKTIKEFLTYSDGEVDIVSHEVENLDNPNEPLVFNLEYEISNLLTITPEEVIFHTGGLFSPISGGQWKFDPDYRQLPIAIHFDEQHNKNIEINFPPGWQIATDLPEVSLENPFGSIEGQYAAGDGQLLVNQKLALNQSMEPREKYPELLALVGDPSLLHVPSIVFSTTGSTQ